MENIFDREFLVGGGCWSKKNKMVRFKRKNVKPKFSVYI